MFLICIIVFTALSFHLGEILLPPILKLKIKNSRLRASDQKLWMKFLEKELEARKLHLQIRIHKSSLLGFYEKNFKHKILKGLPVGCYQMNFKSLDGIQKAIYGEICGSSKGARKPEYLEGKSTRNYIMWSYKLTNMYVRYLKICTNAFVTRI